MPATDITADGVVAAAVPADAVALVSSDVLGTAGVTWTNTGEQLLVITNSDASDHVVTFPDATTLTAVAGDTYVVGPFDAATYPNPVVTADADALHAWLLEASSVEAEFEATVDAAVTTAHSTLETFANDTSQTPGDRRIASRLAHRLAKAYRDIHGTLPS